MSRPLFVSLVALSLVLGTLIASADEGAARRAALRAAEEPLRDGRYEEAARALAAFRTKYAGTPEAVEAWVLEARAYLKGEDPRRALAATTDFLAVHGEDAWAGRMRHTAAKAYEALGQTEKASDLLKALADDATAPAARARIGALHAKLGDEDFDGVEVTDNLGRKVKQRNIQRAHTSYSRALAIGVAPNEVPRIRERMAQIQEERKQFPQAAASWDALLDALGMRDRKVWGDRDDNMDEAAFERYAVGRARAQLGAGRRAEARADLTQALAVWPKGKRHMEILLLLGKERVLAWEQTSDDVAFEEGVDWLRKAIEQHRDDPEAVKAQRELAGFYAQRGKLEQAAAEWLALVQRFPKDAFVPYARNQAADALQAAGKFDRAIQEWERFLAAHPNHELWEGVRAAIVNAHYLKAVDHKAKDRIQEAIEAYRAFAETYPTEGRAPMALVAAGSLLRQAKDVEAALAVWRGVTGRYAKSRMAPMAYGLIAVTLEDDQGKLEDAIAAYEELIKKHPRTPQARDAQRRLERLRAKHLEVRSEQVVGLGDPKRLRVLTRNISSLRVRVYKLGIEEYFRRKGTVAGVENLQLEIVKPDWTLEWELDPYKPFALIEADRALPVTEPGAYVVVAGDDDLTATCLLLVSDLEIVVKRARDRQLFVWAFDRATQQPVSGARVLAAGKRETLGKTGADGVWKGKSGSSTGGVLVVSDKGPATTAIPSGKSVSHAGFRAKAYVYTDRPVYRPGHKVHWRAVFLDASGGAYRGGQQHRAWVKLYDARGQQVRRAEVKASAHGVYAGSFELDGAAPLGQWRVQLEVRRRGTWNGTFQVEEFKKPEFTVAIVPDEPVYLTGRTVQATVRLRYAFGGAVPEAPVDVRVYRFDRTFAPEGTDDYSWYFKDDRPKPEARRSTRGGVLVKRERLVTDAQGEVRIEFDTRVQDGDAEYVVQAAAQDVTRRWIADQGRIPVTRADHMAVVKTDRKVYRPKQRMKIEVRTMDARGVPVARSGEVVLYRVRTHRVPVDVKRRGPRPPPAVVRDEEVEEARVTVTTNERGRAEVELEVPEPGRLRVRWKAKDTRGTLVTAHADCDAAGEAEDLSKDARLVASRTLYREGDDVELLVHSPRTGVKALLTYEGEQVLEHRILDLRGKSTLVALPVRAKHAPNVFFKVAIPGGEKLLEADTEIVVLRHLDVRVRMPKASAAPGEEIEVQVQTLDAQGKPVSAEVGVGLVDETVYAVARDVTPPIRPHFYDKRRVNAVVTASSIGARYYGTTRETSKDLLADQAARKGGAKAVALQDAIRLAREALRDGRYQDAVGQAVRALELDSRSWDARNLMAELTRDDRARKQLELYARTAGRKLEDQLAAGEVYDIEEAEKSVRRFKESAKKSKGMPTTPDSPADFAKADGKPMADKDAIGFRPSGGGRGGQYRGPGGAVPPSLREPSDPTPPAPIRGAFVVQGEARSASPLFQLGKRAEELGYADLSKGQAAFGLDFGGLFQVRKTFADTAAWFPHVVTNEKGEAKVKVTLPDNLTTWRATARGVSKSALVGEGRGSIVARKRLLLRVDPPRFLVQSDEVTIPSVVHNNTDGPVEVTVEIDAEGIRIDGDNETLKVALGGRGLSDRRFRAHMPGTVKLEARAISDGGADAVELSFGALPRGIKTTDGRTGVVDTRLGATQETFLEVPENVVPGTNRLVIVLYPGLEDALLDRVVYLEFFPYGCVEQTVHRFLPALQARAAIRAAGRPMHAQLARLDVAIRRAADRLRNLQNDDGSFGWFGRGKGDLAMTAYALLGLAGAREGGVSDLNNAIERAAKRLPQMMGQGTEDQRALAHYALASIGRIHTESYATTFRRRSDDLSVAGLAWMSLAATRLERSFDVSELTRLLLERRVEKDGLTSWPGRRRDCFVGSGREATGLALQALIEAEIETPHVDRGFQWLLQGGGLKRIGTTKDAAAFVGAASAYMRKGRMQGFGGTVEILLDGRVVRTVKTGAAPLAVADRRFEIPEADALRAGRHKLTFRLAGEGRLGWAARLESVVASKDLPADEHGLRIARSYLTPEEAPVEGQPPAEKPGYTILRPSARPKVEAKDLEVVGSGDRVLVRLKVETERALDYVLIEDPLPAGFEVLADTTRGPFDWQERRDQRQVFFATRVPAGGTTFEYVMQATHLGSFTALGTTAHAMYAPEFHGRAEGRTIRILTPAQAHGGDTEREPTPDEIYQRGKRFFAEEKYDQARPIFETLRTTQPLRDVIVEEIEAHLLKIAIETKDAREIVRAREALIRRNPKRIPGDLDTQRAIAGAYHEIDEFEVANNLFRDLVTRGFALHAEWSRTLASRGREIEGLDGLGTTLNAFPIANATAQAAFQRAQRYRELRRPTDRSGGPAGAPMDEDTLDALWSLTAHYAGTPIAAPATYALVGALRRAAALDQAIVTAEAFLRRFPDSHFVDDCMFFLADSRFRIFEEDPSDAAATAVREAAEPLVKQKFKQSRGGTGYSEFRARAYHILARVHHVRGELDAAIRMYKKAGGIEDAREALAYLTAKEFRLDGTHVVAKDGKPEFRVTYRNVDAVELSAYPVDLQVLFAVRKTLVDLHRVDLSGIVPPYRWQAKLPDSGDHQAHERTLELPVEGSEPGVWLVIAKAGGIEASTLVIRTDLKVVLQRIGQKVRAYVTDATGRPIRGARVTVSNGREIRARGVTDGRGVFEAPGVGADVSVVVSKGERYAIAR
ncbi:MAG: MG2 domain-containing protein [Planctomycetota bacterium]|nr:MG2 domain-containing protein [Planctomycetota bacterium]